MAAGIIRPSRGAKQQLGQKANSVDAALGQALWIDSHDCAVAPHVWALYARLIARIGPRPTLIERDGEVPEFAELLLEREQAAQYWRRPAADLTQKPRVAA